MYYILYYAHEKYKLVVKVVEVGDLSWLLQLDIAVKAATFEVLIIVCAFVTT